MTMCLCDILCQPFQTLFYIIYQGCIRHWESAVELRGMDQYLCGRKRDRIQPNDSQAICLVGQVVFKADSTSL